MLVDPDWYSPIWRARVCVWFSSTKVGGAEGKNWFQAAPWCGLVADQTANAYLGFKAESVGFEGVSRGGRCAAHSGSRIPEVRLTA